MKQRLKLSALLLSKFRLYTQLPPLYNVKLPESSRLCASKPITKLHLIKFNFSMNKFEKLPYQAHHVTCVAKWASSHFIYHRCQLFSYFSDSDACACLRALMKLRQPICVQFCCFIFAHLSGSFISLPNISLQTRFICVIFCAWTLKVVVKVLLLLLLLWLVLLLVAKIRKLAIKSCAA